MEKRYILIYDITSKEDRTDFSNFIRNNICSGNRINGKPKEFIYYFKYNNSFVFTIPTYSVITQKYINDKIDSYRVKRNKSFSFLLFELDVSNPIMGRGNKGINKYFKQAKTLTNKIDTLIRKKKLEKIKNIIKINKHT